jgi:hypothetical protein
MDESSGALQEERLLVLPFHREWLEEFCQIHTIGQSARQNILRKKGS